MHKDEWNAFLFMVVVATVLLCIGGFKILMYANERDTFNKFKRPDQPAATIKDAMFSDLRITN